MKRIKSYCKKAWNWLADLFKSKFCPLPSVSGGSQDAQLDHKNEWYESYWVQIPAAIVIFLALVAVLAYSFTFAMGAWFGFMALLTTASGLSFWQVFASVALVGYLILWITSNIRQAIQ